MHPKRKDTDNSVIELEQIHEIQFEDKIQPSKTDYSCSSVDKSIKSCDQVEEEKYDQVDIIDLENQAPKKLSNSNGRNQSSK